PPRPPEGERVMTTHPASILVVDDDEDTRRNLSDILTDLGYHAETAHDGPSALELVRRRPFDVALLDLKMPGMDGLTLYRERGYRVGLAHSQPEAARRLGDQTFRVVLIDLKLPEGDGSGVFRLVRESRPQARTVLITGFPAEMDPVVRQVLAEGADAVCYK